MHSRAQFALPVLLLTAALCLGVARTGHASLTDQSFTGTVTGAFSSPVEKSPCNPTSACGNLKDAQGNVVSQDNTGTAVISGLGTNTFTWGSGIGLLPPPAVPSSSFMFMGANVTGVHTTETCSISGVSLPCTPELLLGTFTFT